MHVLITGANGFVGRHLLTALQTAGHQVSGQVEPGGVHPEGVRCLEADIRDGGRLEEIVTEVRPEACVHLAGIAHVPTATEQPALAFSVNVIGTVNLLEAFRHHDPQARILVVTSAEVYGKVEHRETITESTPLRPSSMYGITKAAADQAARMYAAQYGMDIMVARPENHNGPGQSPQFVSSAFAHQLATRVLSGSNEAMAVGNLESTRDFTDVRDVAEAYRLLLEQGERGEAYNIASANPVRIGTLLDRLMDAAGIHPPIEVNPEFFRPTDHSPHYAIEKLQAATGWKPTHPLEQTLEDIFRDVVDQLKADAGV